ncbi:hypothetical protein Ade02nite_10570 [Paractinoplanes deccanensis]|uniref:Gram-positive cocci surface proteins LPxTG domain-containing protein n=2 Tax=Paractinoplanes deccanensis TaxID=113561 RepID=A0ABQ3XXD3_9ACTN|nr:hypothetical protein Ade02nite_10570 [Actinoplanes deccanensis]
MPIMRPSRPPRTHHAFSGTAAVVAALAVVAAPLTPASARESAGVPGKCAGTRTNQAADSTKRGSKTETDQPDSRFTANAQADLVKINLLDAGVLRPDLPSLVDVRLAAAHGSADSAARRSKTTATGRYADAKLLGMQLPGLPLPGTAASRQAPPTREPATAELAGLQAAGLATVQLGRSTADARWLDAYNCGATGPLTRSATMLAGVQLLAGGGRTPALQALRRAGDTPRKTSLLRLGPTGSTQSATDLVRLDGGRRGVSAAAGVALSDLTLFGGTPQEVSIKVVTQPTLAVIAAGDRKRSSVKYRPAVLKVTAAGKPVTTLDTADAGVSVDLYGGLSAGKAPAVLSARISLGSPRQLIGDRDIRAEAAALRVEVVLGRAHLLDVAIGYLYAQASTPPMKAAQLHAVPGTPGIARNVAPQDLPPGVDEPSPDALGPQATRHGNASPHTSSGARAGAGSGPVDGAGSSVVDGAGSSVVDGAGSNAVDGAGSSATGSGAEDGAGSGVAAGAGSGAMDRTSSSALARAGTNIIAAAIGGLILLVLGVAAVTLSRRRRRG